LPEGYNGSPMNTTPFNQPCVRATVAFVALLLLLLTGCRSGSVLDKESAEHSVAGDSTVVLTPEALKNVQLEVLSIETRPSDTHLSAMGEIRADENQVFHINAPVAGRVIQDRVRLGDAVSKGQVLAVIQNLEVAKVHSQFIHDFHQNEIAVKKAQVQLDLAKKNMAREKRLLEEGISPRKDYLQAEADLTMATAELAGLQEHRTHLTTEAKALMGVYGNHLGDITSERIQSASPLNAPFSGVVTRKTITVGDQVRPEDVLYEVADLHRVWLNITIYPKDLSVIRLGQGVSFTSDAVPGKVFQGVIDYLQPTAEGATQTYVARVFLDNPEGVLKPGTLGQVSVDTGDSAWKPFIPSAALQTYGAEHFVFVAQGQGRFKKQPVTLGEKVKDGYLVESGLASGAKVVGRGSFVLKAELLKGQFGDDED